MTEPITAISVEDLTRFCREYDQEHRSWPEHEYEGWSVLQFILGRVSGEPDDLDAPEDWPGKP